jgi:hypothetical protein
MSTWRRLLRKRPYALCLAGGLLAFMAGDRASLAPPPGTGIDPFEVLDQQVRNNVLIILDTSGSMKWPVDRDNFSLGADDPGSRMFQAKAAVRAVVAANQNRVNFGLMSYNILSNGKTLTDSQDFAQDGRIDGPFVYVSADAAAAPFYTTYSNANDTATGESEACNNIDGFFCFMSNTFANYDGTNSGDVWRSFLNRSGNGNGNNGLNNAYPAGCVAGTGVLSPIDIANPASMRCRYYMESRYPRRNVRYTWSRTSTNVTTRLIATANNITCPAPPAGLLGYNSTVPSCFQMQDGTNGPIATYYYTSGIYENQSGNACGGGALITSVAPCTGNNAPTVLSNMDPELPVNPTTGQLGSLTWPPPAPPTAQYLGVQTTPAGLRADQSTPLAGSLNFISNTANPSAFPGWQAPQKNFVILLTDGDDTCADPNNVDRSAVLAGVAASNLFNSGNNLHKAETLVVGFASAVSPARVNVIAQGGSGATINPAATNPATAVTGCPAGNTCRNAFFATNTQQLIDILNAALEQASSSGLFSGTPSVFDGVPEYVDLIPLPVVVPTPSPAPSPYAVLNPDTRYRANSFRQYRALFEVNGFQGKVQGYDEYGAMTAGPRPAPSPLPAPAPNYLRPWEAGQRMIDTDRVSSDLATTDHTFAELMVGSANPLPAGPTASPVVQNHIHRRIFTTVQNGRLLGRIGPTPAADNLAGAGLCGASPSCRANIWPPDPLIAPGGPTYAMPTPPALAPSGSVDTRLLRKADGTQMTIVELQAAPLYACMGATAPAACNSTTAAVKLAAAQKEAREMILAFTAGAAAQRDGAGHPLRNATGLIRYRRRPWLLSESTIGTPAVVVPPGQITPTVHTQEYLLYRDGPRDNTGAAPGNTDSFIRSGFGLRNPDADGRELPQGTQNRPLLKPVMSVVYVPANDMLHAFRAGPCPAGVTTCQGTAAPSESGAEELWAFVPHDLLPSLKDKMKVQTRTDHTYMISTSLRVAEVFVPGATTLTLNGKSYAVQGRWRRMMFFGRGLGGKYYTALDITGVGSLTSAALDTDLPGVLWNRGNPDTIDGTLATAPVNTAGDATLYADMGQTWSTPNVARVTASALNGNREFMLFTGSGYSSGPVNEGTRFYSLDPLTGDVVASDDVGEGGQTVFQNALLASPVVYSATQLVGGVDLPHPASSPAESVFIGDIHGRLWKFNANNAATRTLFRNLGPAHPIGLDGAVLNVAGAPHVFVNTGADVRVGTLGEPGVLLQLPAEGFAFYGFRDDGGPIYPTTQVPVPLGGPPDFSQAFGHPPPTGKGHWRGTLQPVTTFNPANVAQGQVFFTGTRFNPIAAGACVTTFDTIIFGLNADTGGTAYATQTYTGVKAVGTPWVPIGPDGQGNPPVDQGTGLGGAPPITGGVFGGTAGLNNGPNQGVSVKNAVVRNGSTVCR